MKKYSLFTVALITVSSMHAQTEKFDIASFTPPAGWERNVSNGSISFMHTKTENGVTSFCQIVLYPSVKSSGKADKDFKAAWQNLVEVPIKSKAKPVTQTEITSDGWTVVTGSANVSTQGLSYKTIVSSITGFGKNIYVQVNTAGGDYGAVLDNFFHDLNLDGNATVANPQTSINGALSMKDYDFIAPDKWQVQNNKDHIAIINPRSGCMLRILNPQQSSGDLEQDVNAVFDMMYNGWSYQRSGEQQYLFAKGRLTRGLEYCRKEATMTGYTADGRYHLQEGGAVVVKAGSQIVIISQNHNSSELGHDDCYRNYNTVARFFNSFFVKNATLSTGNAEDAAKRIIGLWKIVATGVVAGDYAFAANGNFQSGGGLGSSTTTFDMYYEYIYNRAYSFQGDGSYSIIGNQLTLKKRGSPAETVTIRFEKVSHGGSAWKDRIYMLKKDSRDEFESAYEKQTK